MFRSGNSFMVFADVCKRPRYFETSETKCPLRQKNGELILRIPYMGHAGWYVWTSLESCSYLNAAVWETVAYKANRRSLLYARRINTSCRNVGKQDWGYLPLLQSIHGLPLSKPSSEPKRCRIYRQRLRLTKNILSAVTTVLHSKQCIKRKISNDGWQRFHVLRSHC